MKIVMADPAGFTAHYDANLCHALARRGHDVTLDTSPFLFEQVSPLGGYEVRNVFFGPLERLPALASFRPIRRAAKAAGYPLELLQWAADVARTPPEILHLQWSLLPALDVRALARIRRRGTRIVHTVHDVEPLPGSGSSLGARNLYRRADALVVHSGYSRSRLLDSGDVTGDRIHVIPLGGPGLFAAPAIDQGDARGRLGLESDATYLLFFGLIKRHKGLDLLLDALGMAVRKRPELRLVVAGEPLEGWTRYRSRIERLGLSTAVELHLRFVPSELVPVYFSAADLVVLPYRETFQSGVALAAYTFARPVLATSVGGLPELVEDGQTGFLASPEPTELAGALIRAAEQRELLPQLGAAGRARLDAHHSWERIALLHEELYGSLTP